MSRASSRFELAAARARDLYWLAVACCALPGWSGCSRGNSGPEFPTSATFPLAARHPPSFAADEGDTQLGASQLQGGAGVAQLSVPLDPEDARQLVGQFFMAVLLESSRELFPLFAAEAWVIAEGSRQPAQTLWRARLAQLDYGSLAGRIVAGPGSLHTYTFQTAARARKDGVAPPTAPGEVVVVAKLSLSWAGKTRLFGDRLAFRLRPKLGEDHRGRFEIAEIAEDFRLP